ncbi:hypothetical protein [Streptomyces sp. SID9124]|uniref:hypothetical protein n=1 Tax=Streptomyces sp. SID9124 TaxID=2706108 RepID=UPI0013E00413|nr:hypothetical protein [Streptomyces sp. SID9124]NED11286.1 hypothetical protein [Streptomyces sp. SID9124]
MDLVGQLVTIAAVLVGALTTHMTNHLMERHRTRYAMLTRWDERKLEAYAGYIDRVRRCIYSAVLLYEVRSGMRTIDRAESDLTLELAEAEGSRMRAFERVMLLAENQVIEAAHGVNRAAAAIDWQSRGATEGTLADWRELHRAVFSAINVFHEAARNDLGVNGTFHGNEHSSRDLILPRATSENES